VSSAVAGADTVGAFLFGGDEQALVCLSSK